MECAALEMAVLLEMILAMVAAERTRNLYRHRVEAVVLRNPAAPVLKSSCHVDLNNNGVHKSYTLSTVKARCYRSQATDM